MLKPYRFRTAADAWYVALYLQDRIDFAVNMFVQPPHWLDSVGLWLCKRHEAAS